MIIVCMCGSRAQIQRSKHLMFLTKSKNTKIQLEREEMIFCFLF